MEKRIGKNLKVLRERMGFSQRNIACFLGVDQSLISEIERGERNISADMLEELACLFGIPVEAVENNKIGTSVCSLSFRASNLTAGEMKAISTINRIALNSEYMAGLLEEAI